MENVQLLIPVEPKEFWRRMKSIVEEVIRESQVHEPQDKQKERLLVKVKEVCEIFHVSKPTVYDWLNTGKIKSIKIKTRRYFRWKDIEELIEKSKVK
jgi:excisionase family DNA binding protein